MKEQDRTFRKRSKLLRFGLLVGMSSLVLRLFYVQVAEANSLSDKAQDWIKTEKDVVGTRGAIYDRNGQKLAFTGVAYDINVDVSTFRQANAKDKGDTPEEYAKFLAPLLGMTEQEVLGYIANTDPKVQGVGLGPKGKKVDASIAEKLDAAHKEKKYKGITANRVDIRRYPNGALASHVLGFYGISGTSDTETGLAGVESVYDKELTGVPGHVEYFTDRDGYQLPNYEPKVTKQPTDGKDIVLTIDGTIQHFVEDELDNIVQKYAPKHATIIVADPNNGEILALGNRPTFKPAEYATSDKEALWNNWALRSFEPGSTFKTFVMTGALAEHKLDLSETFQSGSITVDGMTVRDWNGTGFGNITFREGVYNSSNVGFVKIGQKLGKESLYNYLYQFGFDKPTGIDLPGEENSSLFDPKKMSDIDLASTSFGQGVSVTPMQQVAAMMAVCNGGKVFQPHVVKEFRDQKSGATVQEVQPKVAHEVANPEVFQTVRQVLEETVLADANKTDYIKGYHVAGKTGTAQVPKEKGAGYDDSKYRLSFTGFAPANNPRLLIYVDVDQATRNAPLQFGSIVAAPSGKVVLEEALRYLQVPIDPNDNTVPDKNAKPGDAAASTKPAEPKTFVKVPDLIGTTKDQANELTKQNGLKIQGVGDGPKVTGQWPDITYGQIPEGTEVKVYFGPEGSKDGKVKMPDLRGLSMREAMETLSLLQLQMEPSGSGYVTKQATAPGTMVPFGTTVKLDFSPQS
ncbi:PASTA domain-containing protein [Tumebacillus sp. ITR2]|uniref:PASTA domain-containing protein n=1 Tax=Tumebacillus amylolyticus TaxID=2801339 RepID=A0ABS1JCP4_9BACL|nr:PASTA domain-containing penicillin-binding protein [Tumebacillus amylolyticus]MBL0388004.1 PASTA domain-containing protein [Tumebacillus amylolyticus]